MKNILSLLALTATVVFGTASTANAAKYTLANGSFNISNFTLTDGDTLELPANGNVTMSATQTIGANIVFNIYGNLNITGNNKSLTIGSGSTINIFPLGSITGSNTTQSVYIGSNRVFSGTQIVNSTSSVMTATGLSNGFSVGTPLPLQFISFDARLSAASVVLNWTAVNDGPNGSFSIQLSTDGKSWNEMAAVAAEGADHQSVSYSRELAIPQDTRTAIYRIAYTSTTGEVVYTQARSLSLNTTAVTEPVVAVVAANNTIQVRISGVAQDGQTRLMVTSLDGRILANQTVATDGAIAVAAPVTGMYIVTISDNHSFKTSQKVILN